MHTQSILEETFTASESSITEDEFFEDASLKYCSLLPPTEPVPNIRNNRKDAEMQIQMNYETSFFFPPLFLLSFSFSHIFRDFAAACAVARWRVFDRLLPHYKLFETQAQFIVMTEELGVCWDLIQEDLRHLQRALQWSGSGERREGTNKETESARQRKRKQKKKNGAEEGKRGGRGGSV